MRKLLISTALCAIAACATNPATGKRQVILMSEQEEISLGKQSDADVRKEMGVYEDANIQRYVDRVGQRLAKASHRPNLPWTFTVVDATAVNAFALPGGYIYITRGILPFLRNEAELAAVLGHEVGHVDARHSASAYSKQVLAGGSLAVIGVLAPETQPFTGLAGVGLQFVMLKNSREAELEADTLGVGYAATSGWAPEAMPGLLSTLGRLDAASGSSRGVPNWLTTHPQASDRITKVQQAVAAARTSGATTTNRPDFERAIDGLVFGDSRAQGMVRGNEFVHPELRFAVKFPQGWEIVNSAEQVSARETENGNVAMVLQLATTAGSSVEQTANAGMTKAGFTEASGRRTEINGLTAYVGRYDGVVSNTRLSARAAHIRNDNQTYLLAGIATPTEFSRVDRTFTASIESFRAMSRSEADRIQPNRVDFYTVRAGDTWDSIARGPAGGAAKASTLAIMNGVTPETPPRAGERVRIIVGQ